MFVALVVSMLTRRVIVSFVAVAGSLVMFPRLKVMELVVTVASELVVMVVLVMDGGKTTTVPFTAVSPLGRETVTIVFKVSPRGTTRPIGIVMVSPMATFKPVVSGSDVETNPR